MKLDRIKNLFQDRRLAAFIITASFVYLLRLSWMRWGDGVIDTGRELYVPLQLVRGKHLYRDIFYLYGPFSPYFSAFLYVLLGVHVRSLVYGGILAAALTTLLFYKLSKIYLSVFFSTVMALIFLFVIAFGQYVYLANYTFILPYSYPATHGILFALAAFYFFYKSYLQKTGQVWAYGICASLVFLCRIEIGTILLVSVIPSVLIQSLVRKRGLWSTLKDLLLYGILPALVAGVVFSLFFADTWEILHRSNLGDTFLGNLSLKKHFTQIISGAEKAKDNLRLLLENIRFYVFYGAYVMVGAFLMDRFGRIRQRVMRGGTILLVGLLWTAAGLWMFRHDFHYDLQYRSLPVLCGVAALVSLLKYLKNKNKEADLLTMSLSLFSILMLLRILLHVWVGHYGFYLTISGILIYGIFFFRMLPDLIPSGVARNFFKFNFLIVSVLFVLSHFGITHAVYSNPTLTLSTPRGTLAWFTSEREVETKALIDYLREKTQPQETVVVFPEGLTINFLSERENPLYYYQYLPIDLERPEITRQIISEMESKKIDYVVLTQRDTTEYGAQAFRSDYGREIYDYIVEHYLLYKQFGPMPFSNAMRYGIALFKRKS